MNSKQKALQLVSKGIKASETDIDTATALFLQAWAHDKSDYDVLTAVAASLADLGQYETAMTVLQEALQSQGESDIICSLIGKIAINMQMYDIAEKTLSRSIELNPNNTDGIADLITALSAQNKFAEAEAFIQAALDVFHDSANLYNALGNISLAKSGDRFAAIEAYKKATELDPKDSKYIHNLAIAYYLDEEAQSCYEQAITLAPADPQIHLSYAIYLFQKGKLEEGWKHYEHRNHPDLGYNKSAKYTHDLPNWDGGDPNGKKLLITSEQGIGDEVFFAAALPKLYECAEQLFIGCEPRLQSIIKRSFPKAIVDTHSDQRNYSVRFRSYPEIERNLKDNTYSIDAACLAATALSYQCQSAEDYKALRGGYLKPDPTLVEKYSVIIRKDSKKKNIAVSWRSGNTSGERHNYYGSVQMIVELAQTYDANYFVLQYSCTEEEIALLKTIRNIHLFTDVDLKQDIETNLAILSCVDFSIGPPTATQAFAMSTGCPVWLFSQGLPWTFFGDQLDLPLLAEGSELFLLHDLRFKKMSYLDAFIQNLKTID